MTTSDEIKDSLKIFGDEAIDLETGKPDDLDKKDEATESLEEEGFEEGDFSDDDEMFSGDEDDLLEEDDDDFGLEDEEQKFENKVSFCHFFGQFSDHILPTKSFDIVFNSKILASRRNGRKWRRRFYR